MSKAHPSREKAERALHNRLILSSDDLREAREYALLLVKQPELERTVREALGAGLIVAYGRCFVAGKRKASPDALPALPGKYLRGLAPEMRLLHRRLLLLRNREFAHSDSDVASIRLERYHLNEETFLVPSQRRLRVGLEADDIERAIALINFVLLRVDTDLADIQHRMATDPSIPSNRVI